MIWPVDRYDLVIVSNVCDRTTYLGHFISSEDRDAYPGAFASQRTAIYATRLDLLEADVALLKGASFRGGGRTGPDHVDDLIGGLNGRRWTPREVQSALDQVCSMVLGD